MSANNREKMVLVIGYGESDVPEQHWCRTREEVRDAIAICTFGSVKDADPDSVEVHMEMFDDPDNWDDSGMNNAIRFEIGGLRFIRLAASPASETAPEPDHAGCPFPCPECDDPSFAAAPPTPAGSREAK